MGTNCPRCGFTEAGHLECPKCGVVFAKLNHPARPAPAAPLRNSSSPVRQRFTWFDAALALALIASVAVIWSRSTHPLVTRRPRMAPPARQPFASVNQAPQTPMGETASDPPSWAPAEPDWTPEPSAPSSPATVARASPLSPEGRPSAPSAEDEALVQHLRHTVAAREEIDASLVYQAEDLYSKYPGLPVARQALEGLLEEAARQAVGRRQSLDAVRYLVRATELWPESPRFWPRLIQIHETEKAWRDEELAARRGLSARPDDAFLHRTLATALMMQGRDDEAADVLRRLLARQEDAAARALLVRLEKELGPAAGMARKTNSHFNVRFEGQADDALGRALLEMLEDKHALLARILGFEPDGEITVILYPKETFRSISTGASWSSGNYSHFDGRIRIGARNLSAGFIPVDLERTLTHELTHAFVAWRTRGALPADINEGLAQYLSGRRLGYRLAAGRTVVVDGRMKVDDFYDAALSLVEYLLDRYQQSAMNQLLQLMGETGGRDQAFRRAYGKSYDETRQEWIKQLQ